MLDPISEMLTCIRNASRAGHTIVSMPSSKMKVKIAQVLAKEGFVGDVSVSDVKNGKCTLSIGLTYRQIDRTNQESAIREINRVSREGQRVYVRSSDIRAIKNGFGVNIVSTSQGVMTGKEARKKHLGGEIICEVW